jgi:hypothetical protein
VQQCHREIGARVRWENWQEGSHYSRNLKHEICQPIDLIAAAKGCWLDLPIALRPFTRLRSTMLVPYPDCAAAILLASNISSMRVCPCDGLLQVGTGSPSQFGRCLFG